MIFTKIGSSVESIASNSSSDSNKPNSFKEIRRRTHKRTAKLVRLSIKSPPPPPPDLQMHRQHQQQQQQQLSASREFLMNKRNSKIVDLGILKVDPNEYTELYHDDIRIKNELPSIAKDLKAPPGLVFAADHKAKPPILEGDVHALKFLDLEAAGLAEYTGYKIFDEIFYAAKRRLNGYVFLNDLQRMLLIMNSRLNKSYGYTDAVEFYRQNDQQEQGFIEFDTFKEAFLRHFLL